jgi:chemotaxis protein CheD
MGDFHALAAREIFLNPGELGCGGEGQVFGTLLGSCVALTLWHPQRRLGCICHYILPFAGPLGRPDGRYASTAFGMMKHELARNGIALADCEAKLFGGGRMFDGSEVQDVGARNIDAGYRLLAAEGMLPVAANVGDRGYRRLYFDVASGDVWVKFDWLDSDQQDIVL